MTDPTPPDLAQRARELWHELGICCDETCESCAEQILTVTGALASAYHLGQQAGLAEAEEKCKARATRRTTTAGVYRGQDDEEEAQDYELMAYEAGECGHAIAALRRTGGPKEER